MKLGYSMFSFSENIDLKDIFSNVSLMKYDGVEPVLSEEGYLNPSMREGEVLEIKKMANANGLEIPSVGVWSLWDNNPVSNDLSIRKKAVDIIERQLEFASILGADTILVIPGYTHCSFAKNPEKVAYNVAYDRAYELFFKLEKVAREYKVSIGIENVWNKFLLSPLEIRKFLDDINSEYVGSYFDVGNIMYIGDPSDYIEILGRHIKKIHISDYRVEQSGLGAFVDIFAGDVDFFEVIKSLKKIGYDDYLMLEMLPNYKRLPELSIYSNKPAMDRLKYMYETL
ncbi:sugar phosphate isomerase/epimerase family protein [Lachnoanaerobaculum umeaense]|uniref:Sugar phosphate isomerase/epimerase n=1 Tax=Lachnoanaerobaculum umeaense TaxID=617123 RepID=A0A385Q2J0_9FIRM|nr:sugar phosphate isomerase/epimerase family protein [Lachnoanaerobaculum umeaense]AYB00553.1 sugar phosphate isomerase/epimerase [Lachnoanaerobaculum umeaense]PZW92601.1 hexulose-6-phosphate isomerase [Lachnoanaerobaculum umeaense]